MRHRPPSRIAAWVAVAVTCVAIAHTDLHRLRAGTVAAEGDFQHFYFAADAERHGRDPYAAWTRGYIYPPLLAWAAQPIAALGYDRAAAVMLVANVAGTLVTLTLLAVEFRRRFALAPPVGWVVLVGLLLDVDKVKGEWQMWQTDVWMLLLFALALRWLDRRPAWAGVALGAAANLKYLPLLLLPYLLVRRRWTAAASLVISSVVIAVLPAVQVGWGHLGHQWATAARGLTGMAGGDTAAERAAVHGVGDSLSCSVTSAFARGTGSGPAAFALSAAVATAALAAAAVAYRRAGVPLLGRPAAAAITGVEWPVLVAALLAFSPQTNTRHLFDALLVTTAAAVLLLARPTWPLAIAMAVLTAGFTLPIGSRTAAGEWSPTTAWLRLGGPCWCLLAGAGGLLWAGLPRRSAERWNRDGATKRRPDEAGIAVQ